MRILTEVHDSLMIIKCVNNQNSEFVIGAQRIPFYIDYGERDEK